MENVAKEVRDSFYSEIRQGIEYSISEKEFKEKIARYKLHVKKHAKYWREMGFNYVLISRVYKTNTRKTYGGVIDVNGFATLAELEKYAGNGIFNIVYL